MTPLLVIVLVVAAFLLFSYGFYCGFGWGEAQERDRHKWGGDNGR